MKILIPILSEHGRSQNDLHAFLQRLQKQLNVAVTAIVLLNENDNETADALTDRTYTTNGHSNGAQHAQPQSVTPQLSIDVRYIRVSGYDPRSIAHMAHDLGIDMIVLPVAEPSALETMLKSNGHAKLIYKSHIPTLSIPWNLDCEDIERIAVVFDDVDDVDKFDNVGRRVYGWFGAEMDYLYLEEEAEYEHHGYTNGHSILDTGHESLTKIKGRGSRLLKSLNDRVVQSKADLVVLFHEPNSLRKHLTDGLRDRLDLGFKAVSVLSVNKTKTRGFGV